MTEEWKDIKGHLGYAVSSRGRVKSKSRWLVNKNGIRRFWKERILITTLGGDGYLCIAISKLGRKNHWLHELVATAFIPNPENKPCVNHIDFDKWNCCAENLEWATYKENMEHASRNNLIRKGEEHSSSKLKERDIPKIIQRIRNGETQSSIADSFGVSPTNISCIWTFKTWKHIKRGA